MESNEAPSVSTVPEPQETHSPKKQDKRRRSLRGRRSLVTVAVEGSSPAVIIAPLSDSIVKNTAVGQVVQLTQKRDHIASYLDYLKSEKEEWEERLRRQKMCVEQAERNSGCVLELKNVTRKLIEDFESIQKPRYILNRVLRAFNTQNENLSDQKTVDKLLKEVATMENSIAMLKSRAANFVSLLNAEPREALLAHRKWWEDLKIKQDRRVQLIKERLDYIGYQESSLEENCTFVIS